MGKRAVVLVIALVLAAAAGFTMFQYLANIENEVLAGQTQVPVFRAVQPIAEGTQGSQILQGVDTLYVVSVEEQEDLPADAIQTESDLSAILENKVAVGPISANGILTRAQWVELNTTITPLTELISEGMMAMTISPGDVQGVNGFVQPGDKINVIGSFALEFDPAALGQTPDFGIPVAEGTDPTAEQQAQTQTIEYTRTVLQGLKVLATGQAVVPVEGAPTQVNVSGEPSDSPPDTVAAGDVPAGDVQTAEETQQITTIYTVEVDVLQAEKLVYAINYGAVHLTLVPDDFTEVATTGVTIDTLFTGDLVQDIFTN